VTDEMHERDPVLDKIVRRLVVAYQPEWIYLFGSNLREGRLLHAA
jgi:hypothetical protein